MPALQGRDFARRPAETVSRRAPALLALLRAVPAQKRGVPASWAAVAPVARARGSPGELANTQKGCLLQHKDKDPSTVTKPRLWTEIAQ